MLLKFLLVLIVGNFELSCSEKLNFPDGFSFGAASAAFQIGGWNLDGKSPSIWDTFIHNDPHIVADKSNGDEAADSYHLYKEDVKALKYAGHYRFSIAWTRILPDGSNVNMKGIEYYSNLIDELLANNIEPRVTMYHFDLPQYLHDFGGFLNPIFIDYFEIYADTLFKYFGHKVKWWITFNEPYEQCENGYATAKRFLPLLETGEWGGEYICMHNLLIAHAKAYHLYKEKYFGEQQGKIGIAPNIIYFTGQEEDVERAYAFWMRWYIDPIFGEHGNYPKIMRDVVANNSFLEGRKWSRLPKMSADLQEYIKGTADFLGVNYYTGLTVAKRENTSQMTGYRKDMALNLGIKPSWKEGMNAKSVWLFNIEGGLRNCLNWIKASYGNIPVWITENGWSNDETLEDDDRMNYLKVNYADIAKAINEDGCNVIGHSVWSIIDNIEWLQGYTERFGLFYVNFTSPLKERIPKKSVEFVRKITKNRFVEYEGEN